MQLLHGHFIKLETLLARWQLLTMIGNLKSGIRGNNRSLNDICITYDGQKAITDDILMYVAHP